MGFFNKLERKFGRYAIPNLMKYVALFYVLGLLIGSFFPETMVYLGLDFRFVARGQIWRLITFMIPISFRKDIFLVILKVYVFYMIGSSLERAWGAFRLNFYFFSGILLNIISSLIVYLISGIQLFDMFGMYINEPMDLLYSSIFLAFAFLFPDTQFYIYFLIPVKAKYWILFSLFLYGSTAFDMIRMGYPWGIIPIVVSILNFVLFFLLTRNHRRISSGDFERRARYRRQINEGRKSGNVVQFNGRNVITRHKCAVCGRTELDDDQLEFRFCSKCDGNYEYCMDHLFTHEHVKKEDRPE